MNSDFAAAMRQAVQLTRQRNLIEATRVIQRALSGQGRAAPSVDPSRGDPRPIAPPNVAEAAGAAPQGDANMESARAGNVPSGDFASERVRRPLGETLNLLRQADRSGFGSRSAPLPKLRKSPPVPVPEGAAYLMRTFACEAGSRDYKVYVPSRADGRALPLLVMLHGCTQNPDDFAVGTGMNRLAEDIGFIVAYPRQPTTANPSACWNWFNLADQRRDEGEPSIIAGITRAIISEFRIDAEPCLCGGPLGRRGNGRDHERRLSRALRRGGHSLGACLWLRRRSRLGVRGHARRLESVRRRR